VSRWLASLILAGNVTFAWCGDSLGVMSALKHERDLPTGPAGADGLKAELVGVDDFDSLYRQLRSFAAVVADSDMDPDDLVHDAVVAYLAAGGAHEPPQYLRRTIVNRVSYLRRQHARSPRFQPLKDGDLSDGDEWSSQLAESTVLLDLMEPLSPKVRAALYLVDCERMSSRDAAALLGGSPLSVRALVSRGRRQMRSILGQSEPNLATRKDY